MESLKRSWQLWSSGEPQTPSIAGHWEVISLESFLGSPRMPGPSGWRRRDGSLYSAFLTFGVSIPLKPLPSPRLMASSPTFARCTSSEGRTTFKCGLTKTRYSSCHRETRRPPLRYKPTRLKLRYFDWRIKTNSWSVHNTAKRPIRCCARCFRRLRTKTIPRVFLKDGRSWEEEGRQKTIRDLRRPLLWDLR